MIYTQLIGKIMKTVPFVRSQDAESALISTLETLGYLLPLHLVESLGKELPAKCAAPLSLGVSVSQVRPTAHAGALAGPALERVQEVLSVLDKVLPPELVHDIVDALPPPLANAFASREVRFASADASSSHQ